MLGLIRIIGYEIKKTTTRKHREYKFDQRRKSVMMRDCKNVINKSAYVKKVLGLSAPRFTTRLISFFFFISIQE